MDKTPDIFITEREISLIEKRLDSLWYIFISKDDIRRLINEIRRLRTGYGAHPLCPYSDGYNCCGSPHQCLFSIDSAKDAASKH